MRDHSLMLMSAIIFSLIAYWCYQAVPYDAHLELDSPEYIIIGEEFAHNQRLIDPAQPDQMPPHPIGYHLLIGIIYLLFGQTMAGIIGAQVLLSLLCLWYLMLIARLCIPARARSLLPFLFIGNIGFMVYSQYILADLMLATALTIFLYYFIRFIEQRRLRDLCLAACILGCSVIIKPVALYYGMALIIYCAWLTRKSFKTMLQTSMLFASFFALPINAYAWYNYRHFNRFAVTILADQNLYEYFLPRQLIPRLPIEQQAEVNALLQGDYKQPKARELFKEIVLNNPIMAIKCWLLEMMRTFFGLYSTQLKALFNPTIKGGSCSFFNMHGSLSNKIISYLTFGASSMPLRIIAILEAFLLPFYYASALIGLIWFWWRRGYHYPLFFCSYIGYLAFVTGCDGCGRFRLMFEPLLMLLAAAGIAALYALVIRQKLSYSTKQSTILKRSMTGKPT